LAVFAVQRGICGKRAECRLLAHSGHSNRLSPCQLWPKLTWHVKRLPAADRDNDLHTKPFVDLEK
jgi:hypothetical protein